MHDTMQPPAKTGAGIINEIAIEFGIPPKVVHERLWSQVAESRAKVPHAYELLCYRLKTELKWSWPRIGKFCDGRDHKTVRSAARRHAKRIGVELVG